MTIPFVKDFDFAYGTADALSALVTRVICRNPGPFTFSGTGTYLVGQETLAVIDPGPEDIDHLEAILDAARGRPISHILLTHTHLDHCGGAAMLKNKTGAIIAAYSRHPGKQGDSPTLEEGGDFSLHPDFTLRAGDQIKLPDATLTALHTPGHISNHLCFALEEEAALFTGDHIMGWATTVVIPPDGNMPDYMASLDLLLERQDALYYPTHGAPIAKPQEFVAAVKAHRQNREQQIIDRLKLGPHDLPELVSAIYYDTPKALHGAASLNVIAHLEPLIERGSVAQHSGRYQICG